MKIARMIATVAVVISVIGWNAIEFASGYSVSPIVAPYTFLPASFFLLAATLFTTCFAGLVVLIALFRGQFGYAAFLVAVVFVSWALSPWFLTSSAYLRGFAARLRKVSSPTEIEVASQACLSLMPSGGRIFGPRKVMGPPHEELEQNKRAWESLNQFRFVHFLDDTCVVFVDPPDVAFTWGGALPGHWGVHVRASDSSEVPSHYLQTTRLSDRILLFRDH